MIRRLAPLAAAFLSVAPALAGVPEAVDPAEIPNYQVVRPGLAFGGQPAREILGRLHEMGFRTVINLRTEQEGALEEERIVRDQGLGYVWVPVTPGTLSLEDVKAVERVLDDPEAAPVLLHCASSNRVAAVWAVIQARHGRTVEEAEAAGRAAGLHSPSLWEAVLRVLAGAPAPVAPGADGGANP
jgi:uncharacterized protein (TIGR01244 family)